MQDTMRRNDTCPDQQPGLADPTPFLLEGGATGVLLIHGFTGSPAEMRLLGEHLWKQGYAVSAPLLPGHGTTVTEMNRCHWQDWTAAAENALQDLQERCDTVFVAGLSMGSLLTLYLAAQHKNLPGIVLYAPAVWLSNASIYVTPLAKYLIATRPKSGKSDLTDPSAKSRIWSYDQEPVGAASELLRLILRVRRMLPQITCPLLIVHSTGDSRIHPQSAQRTCKRVHSTDCQIVTLENSGHCLTVDSEWRTVAELTTEFVCRHSLTVSSKGQAADHAESDPGRSHAGQ